MSEQKEVSEKERRMKIAQSMARSFILNHYEYKLDNLSNLTMGELFDEVDRIGNELGMNSEQKNERQAMRNFLTNMLYEEEVNDK